MRRTARTLASWARGRTLHARLARITALAVFGAVTLAGAAVFAVTFALLIGQVDDQLRAGPAALAGPGAQADSLRQAGTMSADTLASTCASLRGTRPVAVPQGQSADERFGTLVELADPAGEPCLPDGVRRTGVGAQARLQVARDRQEAFSTVRATGGAPIRARVMPLAQGWTLTVARDVSGPLQVIGRLRATLLGLGLLGALAALIAGSWVARAGLRPIGVLADTAEHIARTQDLSVRIGVAQSGGADDEVTRLADAFERMVAALAASRQRQRRLVADAGHELRTPLTSLRTNIDLLLRSGDVGRPLPPEARTALMRDVRTQLEELTHLVDEVVVLAHDDLPEVRSAVRLDALVRRAVARVRPRTGDHLVETELAAWTVDGADAAGLERAVVNLLDNAVKFSPAGSRIRVQLAEGRLTVDDEGPGVAVSDRDLVFERFWRSAQARGVRGSGLGLAIVADTVAAHGGTVSMGEAPGGGARVTVTVPGAAG